MPFACMRVISRSRWRSMRRCGARPPYRGELIGFAGRIVGGNHRQAHHLLLKQRHAESSFQHRRQ